MPTNRAKIPRVHRASAEAHAAWYAYFAWGRPAFLGTVTKRNPAMALSKAILAPTPGSSPTGLLTHRCFTLLTPAARVSAANALLDRGYGKPPQHITGQNANYVAHCPNDAKQPRSGWLRLTLAERSPNRTMKSDYRRRHTQFGDLRSGSNS
jgi:hypothetical protein